MARDAFSREGACAGCLVAGYFCACDGGCDCFFRAIDVCAAEDDKDEGCHVVVLCCANVVCVAQEGAACEGRRAALARATDGCFAVEVAFCTLLQIGVDKGVFA